MQTVRLIDRQGSQMRSRLRRGSAWALAGRGLSTTAGLSLSIILARQLSPSEFGAYLVFIAIVNTALVPACFGLDTLIVRSLAGSKDHQIQKIKNTLASASISLGFTCSILWLSTPFLVGGVSTSGTLSQIMGYGAGLLVLETLNRLAAEAFRGLHDIRFAVFFGGACRSLFTLMILTVVLSLGIDLKLASTVVIFMIASGLSASIAWALLYLRLRNSTQHESTGIRILLRDASPFFVTHLGLSGVSQADLWILGIFVLESEVALYGAAARFVALVALPLTLVNAVVPPICAEYRNRTDRMVLQKTLRGIAGLTTVPLLLVVPFFVFKGTWLLGVVFGSEYQDAWVYLLVLGAGQLANVCSGSYGVVLQMLNGVRMMMWISLSAACLAIISACLVAPIYGAVAVALCFALAKVLHSISGVLLAKRLCGIWTYASLPLAGKLLRKGRDK